jgi:hypothetical protein
MAANTAGHEGRDGETSQRSIEYAFLNIVISFAGFYGVKLNIVVSYQHNTLQL